MAFTGGSLGDTLATQLSKDIATSQSGRVIIPVCHIYLEHMMTLLIQNKITIPENTLKKSNFSKKIHLLVDRKLLSMDEHHDLEVINDIRNDFVHEFEPEMNSVTDKTNSFKLTIPYPSNSVKTYVDDVLMLMELLEQKIIN